MLKCQFHCHTAGDPMEPIKHSPRELIKEAARLKFDVVAITCHRKVIFTKALQKYAQKKGILLIPGIEFEINKKHILALNPTPEIEKIDSYEKLATYKKSHPDCLVIAAHPFFPGSFALGKDLVENRELFDAVEHNAWYTKRINFNKKGINFARKHKMPLISASDAHALNEINLAYTLLDCAKNTRSITSAIRRNKIKNYRKALKLSKFIKIFTLRATFTLHILKKGFRDTIIGKKTHSQIIAQLHTQNPQTGRQES